MSSKLVSLSIMSYHSKRKTTFIELVELVDLEEKVLQLTLFHLMTLDSSERSKIIITLKSKKCLKILRNSTLLVVLIDFRSITRKNRTILNDFSKNFCSSDKQ